MVSFYGNQPTLLVSFPLTCQRCNSWEFHGANGVDCCCFLLGSKVTEVAPHHTVLLQTFHKGPSSNALRTSPSLIIFDSRCVRLSAFTLDKTLGLMIDGWVCLAVFFVFCFEKVMLLYHMPYGKYLRKALLGARSY